MLKINYASRRANLKICFHMLGNIGKIKVNFATLTVKIANLD